MTIDFGSPPENYYTPRENRQHCDVCEEKSFDVHPLGASGLVACEDCYSEIEKSIEEFSTACVGCGCYSFYKIDNKFYCEDCAETKLETTTPEPDAEYNEIVCAWCEDEKCAFTVVVGDEKIHICNDCHTDTF